MPDEEKKEEEKQAEAPQGAAEAAREKPAAAAPAGGVLVVDDDAAITSMVCDYFEGLGIPAAAAASSEEALGKVTGQTRLAVVDLAMPGADGITLTRALRRKFPKIKVVILTGHPSKESILKSRDLKVSAYLTKPVPLARLRRLAESALKRERSLAELDLPEEYAAALAGDGLVAPLLEGAVSVALEDVFKLAAADPARLEGEGLELAAGYHTVNDLGKIGKLEGREPALRKGARLGPGQLKVLQRFCQDRYGGVVDESGGEVKALLMKRTPQLAEWLAASLLPDEEALRALLRRNKLCRMLLDGELDEGLSRAMEAMHALVRHADAVFELYRARTSENGLPAEHGLAVALLAVLVGCDLAAAGGGGLGEHTALVLALAGFFHDVGALEGVEYGTKDFARSYATHAADGFGVLKGAKLPDAVRYAARDHHKPAGGWNSPFDAVTRVVQVVNDLDNMTRKNGVLLAGDALEMSAAEVDLREACRDMLFAARRGAYRENAIHTLMRICGLSSLFEYYRQVEAIKNKPCAGVILSPDGVHPATAVCGLEGSIARHEAATYCSGRSPTKSHAHEGTMYHRCLSGHDEVSQLNANIKHLDAVTREKLGLAAPQEEARPKAEKPAGAGEAAAPAGGAGAPPGEAAAEGAPAGEAAAAEKPAGEEELSTEFEEE